MDFLIIAGIGFAGGFYAAKQLEKKKYAVHIGEQIVNEVLTHSLNDDDYSLLSNLTLPITDKDGNEGTSQIDHVLISTRGVFVIETKYYAGSIVGLADSPYWSQFTSFDKRKFQNPIRQNHSHIVAINDLTGLPYSDMNNLVVFSGNAIERQLRWPV